MSEPFFLRHSTGLSLAEIAALTGAQAPAEERRLTDVAPLELAGPRDLAFYDDRRFAAAARATRAGACLTTARLASDLPPAVARLIVAEPYRAFVRAARALFPHALRPSPLSGPGVAAGAHVDPSARLEDGVTVEPGAVIGSGAGIGAGTLIGANAVIGAGVQIGRDCAIGSATVVTHALIGDRVIIHPACSIGQDGFGYVAEGGIRLKMPQVGRVIIQDDVEIGAGTTIDRGALRDTVIGEGTKIDNLVQVGHNVSIGRHCVIVAQTGISGSATLEDFVVLGARVGLNTGAVIGEGAQIAALSVVNGKVPPGARWGGTPAKPVKQWMREMLTLERLAQGRSGGNRAGEESES
ncbi:MAG: UDP-3-O-(3-hydroxymyristoyl)glucosamine N-acyltransferase [Pseudolabrys sp.]|nr:UDP-3-O-(3-hydroxymyristoyl)glucosamine N-acyltransferase [Pseudolabrys sp.]